MWMPSDCTISRFTEPARIIMPRRVFWISQYIAAASARQMPEMTSR